MKEIQCPWWCSGEGMDYAIIICYLPVGTDLFEYWDDAYDIDVEHKDKITYTDRFKKPDWIKRESRGKINVNVYSRFNNRTEHWEQEQCVYFL